MGFTVWNLENVGFSMFKSVPAILDVQKKMLQGLGKTNQRYGCRCALILPWVFLSIKLWPSKRSSTPLGNVELSKWLNIGQVNSWGNVCNMFLNRILFQGHAYCSMLVDPPNWKVWFEVLETKKREIGCKNISKFWWFRTEHGFVQNRAPLNPLSLVLFPVKYIYISLYTYAITLHPLYPACRCRYRRSCRGLVQQDHRVQEKNMTVAILWYTNTWKNSSKKNYMWIWHIASNTSKILVKQ